MRSQYGSLRTTLSQSDWTVAVEPGGYLTAGTIDLFIQSHNRVGLNKLSAVKQITLTNQSKVVITVNSSAIASGEDVFKFVISARIGAGNITQIAEINTRLTDNTTKLNLPLTLELTLPEHISTNVNQPLTTGANLIHGQFRSSGGETYRYNSVATRGDIAAATGFWIKDDRAGFVNIDSTLGTYGCDQLTSNALLVFPARLNNFRQSEPMVYWWANNLDSNIGNYTQRGSRLNLQPFIDGQLATSNNQTYSSFFSDRIQIKFLGYVDTVTGVLDSNYPGVNSYTPWNDATGIILPDDVPPNTAVAFEIILDFSHPSLASILSRGTIFVLNIIEELTASHFNPASSLLGNLVTNDLNGLRVVPNKLLSGKAIINRFEFTYNTESVILGVGADTDAQKVIISADTFGVVSVKESPDTNEAIRAIISTQPGTQTISEWYNVYNVTANSSLTLTLNLPIVGDSGIAQVRSNYPDVVAGNTNATFNVPFLILFLQRVGTSTIYKTAPIPLGILNEQLYTLTDLPATTIDENELPQNTSDFGLFGYLEPSTVINAGGGTLLSGDYKIAIAYHYPENNFAFTKISHSVALGAIPEVNTTLVNALNDSSYWLAPALNILTLKSLSRDNLQHGSIIYVLENSQLFWYNAHSLVAEDLPFIVIPSNGIGRFEAINTSGTTLLGNTAMQTSINPGALLTVDTFGNEALHLANANDGDILSYDGNSPTGLTWISQESLSGSGSGGGVTSVPGIGPYRFLTYDASSQPVARRLYREDIVDGLADSKCLLLTQRSESINASVLTHVAPPTLQGTFALTYANNTYNWSGFSLAGLTDTFNTGTTIEHGSQLIYDVADSRWKPGKLLTDIWLSNLKDVWIDNNISNYPLVWNTTLRKYIVGMPDLTHIQGINYTTTAVPIPGDNFFNNTRVLISARRPGQDLVSKVNNISVINATVTTDSPYTGGAGSYFFTRTSRQLIQIPTIAETLIGGNNFCVELWFKPTELQSGRSYTLVGRTNGTQEELYIRLLEVIPSVFEVRFEGINSQLNGARTSIITLTSDSVGIALNTWYHVAVSRNGNEWRLFLNGELQEQKTNSTILTTQFSLQSAIFLCLGRPNNLSFTDNFAYIGYIEDFRLTIGSARYLNSFTVNTTALPITQGGSIDVNNYYLTLRNLTDYDDSTPPSDGNVLTWSSEISKFKPLPIGPGGEVINLALGQLSNVDLTGADTNYVLSLNSSGIWVAQPLGTGVNSVNGLSGNVTLTTDNITQGDVNKYLTPGEVANQISQIDLEVLQNVANNIPNNSFLQKIDGVWQGSTINSPVISVNNLTGAVELTTDNIPESATKEYFNRSKLLTELTTVSFSELPSIFNAVGTTGQFITLDANGKLSFVNPPTGEGSSGSSSLADLTDVTINNPQLGDVLKRTETNWIATALSTDDLVDGTLTERYSSTKVYDILDSITFTDLPNIFTETGTAGQIPALNAQGKLEFINPPSGVGSTPNLVDLSDVNYISDNIREDSILINTVVTPNYPYTQWEVVSFSHAIRTYGSNLTITDLTDVFVSTGTTGQIPALNAQGKLEFINPPSGTSSVTLNDLTDTAIVSPTNGQFIRLDNSSWVNVTLDADMVTETSTREFYTNAKVDTRVSQTTISGLNSVFEGTGTAGQIPALNAQGKLEFAPHVPYQQFRDVTGNHTLELSDHGKIIRITNIATITLPSGLPDGFQVTLFNMTATVTTLSTSGTLLSNSTTMSVNYKAVYVTHVANNDWIALGALDEQ